MGSQHPSSCKAPTMSQSEIVAVTMTPSANTTPVKTTVSTLASSSKTPAISQSEKTKSPSTITTVSSSESTHVHIMSLSTNTAPIMNMAPANHSQSQWQDRPGHGPFISYPNEEHGYDPFTSNHTLSSAVGQGYQTLYGADYSGCNQCQTYRATIEKMEQEIDYLKRENDTLTCNKGAGSSRSVNLLLDDLEHLIARHRMETPLKRSVSGSTRTAENIERSPSYCDSVSASCSAPMASTPTTKGVDNIQTVAEYETFFQPGDNKTRLVEGHDLYIDTTKLHAIRSKTKKDGMKMTRELVAYYFKPSYLASHSATGMKSSKPGLPQEILVPIRDYMTKHYKFSDINSVVNRKCLDTARQLQKTAA